MPIDSVSVEPTTGGYVRIAQQLAPVVRAGGTEQQMHSLLEVVVYLTQLGEQDIANRVMSATPDSAE